MHCGILYLDLGSSRDEFSCHDENSNDSESSKKRTKTNSEAVAGTKCPEELNSSAQPQPSVFGSKVYLCLNHYL